MEFDLVKFSLSPTTEEFNRCREKDLLELVDFYNITLTSRKAKKCVIKDELHCKLVEAGTFTGQTVEQGIEAVTGMEAMSDISSSVSIGKKESFLDPQVTLQLKQLELELKKQEYETQRLHVRALEIKADRDIKLRELETRSLHDHPIPNPRSPLNSLTPRADVDVGKYVKLVPPFRETEVDSYFIAFERIATKLSWPKDMWALLLQCNLIGRAQEVCAALPIEASLDYDTVKAAVLRAYELVPEAYRQKFRACSKQAKQTYVEFAREKKTLFEKWCFSTKITTFEELQELVLLEDFKTCVPESVVVHLNEQKVTKLSDAAVLADEFTLTHRTFFFSGRQTKAIFPTESAAQDTYCGNGHKSGGRVKTVSRNTGEKRVCFYCLDPSHLISDCRAWKNKKITQKPKHVALIQSAPDLCATDTSSYGPFLRPGFVSLTGSPNVECVQILRDTGSAQSFILEDVLPFSDASYTGANVLVRGIEMGCVSVPLHVVDIKSDLATGVFQLGVCKKLPVDNVSFILGNDIAGGNVFPRPVVISEPIECASTALEKFPLVFPACAVTRSQSQKFPDTVDLSNSFMTEQPESVECKLSVPLEMVSEHDPLLAAEFPSMVGREHLAAAQKSDPTLEKCVRLAVDSDKLSAARVGYFWDEGVLMRKWEPKSSERNDWLTIYQVVLPASYRSQVLILAHENVLAGHLGVNKTFQRITKHFFWPGIKSAVSNFCRSCDVCQRAGKPNQTVPKAPLNPIPVIGEPFEKLLIDCVGPLPKSKHGHQYILTMMCTATRYPEAVPLRTLKAQAVLKEILKFCTTFGLPRVIQTDQGSNFTSKVFGQMLKELGIVHRLSSAYHPESQGAIERFHQTLKSMIRTYCVESGKDWMDGLPLLMFAVRESVQESLGFSPHELVFAHTVRGPLKLLKEQLTSKSSPAVPILDYVTSFRKRLQKACKIAKVHLATVQSKMKSHFDKKTIQRSFQPGDSVLVLLPVPGSVFDAKFSGPYVIEQKLNDTDYVLNTPDHRRKKRVCHINLLKRYVTRTSSETLLPSPTLKPSVTVSPIYSPDVEELLIEPHSLGVRLNNSAILSNLDSHLSYLPEDQRKDVEMLLWKHPTLFSDVPGKTSMLFHDIDVGNSIPIKQHLSESCKASDHEIRGRLPAYKWTGETQPKSLEFAMSTGPKV